MHVSTTAAWIRLLAGLPRFRCRNRGGSVSEQLSEKTDYTGVDKCLQDARGRTERGIMHHARRRRRRCKTAPARMSRGPSLHRCSATPAVAELGGRRQEVVN